jgi:hypothetical protein
MPSIKYASILAVVMLVLGGIYLVYRQTDIGRETTAASETAAALPAETALPGVLTHVYRAFSLEDEAAIYDALAGAVAGDLITDLYLQRRSAQVANHAEDGEATILGVEVYEIAPIRSADSEQSFTVAWRVIGRLRHIAHIHERINLYSADLTLTPLDGVWKLTRFTLTNTLRDTDLNFEGGE